MEKSSRLSVFGVQCNSTKLLGYEGSSQSTAEISDTVIFNSFIGGDRSVLKLISELISQLQIFFQNSLPRPNVKSLQLSGWMLSGAPMFPFCRWKWVSLGGAGRQVR